MPGHPASNSYSFYMKSLLRFTMCGFVLFFSVQIVLFLAYLQVGPSVLPTRPIPPAFTTHMDHRMDTAVLDEITGDNSPGQGLYNSPLGHNNVWN